MNVDETKMEEPSESMSGVRTKSVIGDERMGAFTFRTLQWPFGVGCASASRAAGDEQGWWDSSDVSKR